MRRIQTLGAVVVIGSLLLIFFYSTLHLETSYSHRTAPEGPAKQQRSLQVHQANPKTPPPRQEAATTPPSEVVAPPPSKVVTQPSSEMVAPPPSEVVTPPPEVFNLTLSDGLGELTPQKGGYWNRLLAAALRDPGLAGSPAPWSRCRETNRERLRTNMHDFSGYPELFQSFVEGMGCRTPPVLLQQPASCPPPGEPLFLLFAIKSAPGNFARRQAVRETWGRGLGGVRTVFLLGSSAPDEPDLAPLLGAEQARRGDLLQWGFQESFLNLTLKMHLLLRWWPARCPAPAFVFSGDDDVFVNTPALLAYLRSLDPPRASRLYAGHVIRNASPLRDPGSKYYVPPSFFEGPYPPYAGGGGFVFSGELLRPLRWVSQVIPFFPIDDVYVGMCFRALGTPPEAHAAFQTFDVSDKDRQSLCVHKDLILVHQRDPKQIKRLWRGIHSPFLTC